MSTSMRRLIVLRHARAEWESKAKVDHARALDEHGRRDARSIGGRLREQAWVPQVVASSDALRTRETWTCMQAALGATPAVTLTPALYLMGIDEIRTVLRDIGPQIDTVMVIGHNPGWEDAVFSLSGVRARMTPCSAALLSTSAETWSAAADRGDWRLEELLRPDAR